MATILITGGTGLVGKALTKKLLRAGHSVIVLYPESSGCYIHPGYPLYLLGY